MLTNDDGARRLGTFRLSDRQLRGSEEMVALLLAGGVPLRVEYHYAPQAFEYVMLHPDFEFVASCDSAKQYWVAWQGTRMAFTKAEPQRVTFECPSTRQAESWAATMRKMQREHPTAEFQPVYP